MMKLKLVNLENDMIFAFSQVVNQTLIQENHNVLQNDKCRKQ